jgi:6-phosphofructokinase 1
VRGDRVVNYVRDEERVLEDIYLRGSLEASSSGHRPPSFEKSGPRAEIFFDPARVTAAIVTCGGLCPGLNDVIRALVMALHYRYGVKKILGVRYGYAGLIPRYGYSPRHLTPDRVKNIHSRGGTILGSSRERQDVSGIVDTLVDWKVNILFCVGGDGTLRGADDIAGEIGRRGLKISVAGIPKTIDNDIGLTDRSFGFETAFSTANQIIKNAHNEAAGAFNGIALIKLMGRDSGYIAASSTLAVQEVNLVLIPEMEFDLYGARGFLEVLKRRLLDKKHAVVVVSEGAGQFLFPGSGPHRGNSPYRDIGLLLKEKIGEYFSGKNFPFTLKYIDPSYIIRSVPANANDSKFCAQLAQNAVHGAMAGKTGFMVATRHREFVYVPLEPAIRRRKKIDLESELWLSVLETTGQPFSMKN